MTRSDDDIMREARSGNPSAFSEIFERYHRRVYGFVRRLSGDASIAHDITQETFLSAFRARKKYRLKGMLRAWLFRIAANAARAKVRTSSREERKLAESPETTEAPPGPLEMMEAHERWQFVAAALGRLSVEEREVVLLRNHEDMKFREVAEALGITESTAKSRMRYALEKLVNMLGFLEGEMT